MLDVDTQFTAVLAAPQDTRARLSWLAILMDVLVSSMRMCLVAGGIADRLIIASGGAGYSGGRCATRLSPTIDHICVFSVNHERCCPT